MRKLLLLCGLALGLTPALAADNALVITPGAGVIMRTIDDGGAHQIGTSVPVGVNGVSAWGTAGTANANILTVQGIASMTPLLVTATQSGTWNVGTVTTLTTITNPVAATQSGNWTMRNVGNAGAVLDFAGQNVASPANSFLVGGQFNTTPTTITTGNASPLQLDTNGNLLVNVKAGGAGGGAVTVADGADVTQGAKADATCGSAGGTCTVTALLKFLNAAVIGPLPTAASSTAPAVVGGVVLEAGTIGGCTGQVILTAASNNATQIKASAGTLCSLRWENTGTNVYSIRFYDTATAPAAGAPCNSATNVTSNDQAQSNATSPGGVTNLGPYGQGFANGIVVCITGALGSNSDNTNATTGLSLNLSFK